MRTLWKITQCYLAMALRQRLGWIVLGCGIVAVAGGGVVREFHFGSAEVRFLTHYAAAVVTGAGAVLAAVLLPVLFHESLTAGTTVTLLMHGARRGQILLGQFFATTVVLGWLLVICALSYSALMLMLGHGTALDAGWRVLARSALPLLVIAAGATLVTVICQRTVLASVLTLGLALAGYLVDAARPTGWAANGVMRYTWTLVHGVVPDFALFDILGTGTAFAYACAFVFLYLGAALGVFSRREL